MRKLTLYCKSFRRDVLRAKTLAESIDRYNREAIPFYLSVPPDDLPLFRQHLGHTGAILISDDDIVAANPRHRPDDVNGLPGGIAQQIVKSEFWRLGHSECYVCIDSDGEFIRDFGEADFIASDGTPYTVMSEARELLEFCDRYHYPKVRENFLREAAEVQEAIGRPGKAYSFGMPAVWSAKVWKTLEDEVLVPQNLSLGQLIERHAHELRLYGETLLKYRPIPLLPSEYLFKTYFYEPQYVLDRKRNITVDLLRLNYLGILKQSSWDEKHYGPQKNLASRTVKAVKRLIRNLSLRASPWRA